MLSKVDGKWINLKHQAMLQKFDDQAGFNDEELQEAIENINWYQTPEEIEADVVWVKGTTKGIIERTRALRKARGSI